MNLLLQAALDYADCGFSVIPLAPKGKQPASGFGWREFQKRRASEVEIRAWWADTPDANIGIICGQVSGGLVVLDVDPRNGGLDSIRGRPTPMTPVVRTGGGGLHYYYKAARGLASGIVAPGLDFQAEGKLVVAPPSLHPNGNLYAWQDGLALGEVDGAPVPDWCRGTSSGADTAAPEWAARAMDTIAEGKRDNTLTQLAGRYLGLRCTPEETYRILTAINRQYCRPPLPDSAVKRIVGSIAKKEAAKPGATPAEPPIEREAAAGMLRAVIKDLGDGLTSSWGAIERRQGARAAELFSELERLGDEAAAGTVGRTAFARRLYGVKDQFLRLAAA